LQSKIKEKLFLQKSEKTKEGLLKQFLQELHDSITDFYLPNTMVKNRMK
jgi:FKBP-type peptidyl-prolyl cis-trans isomerase (trigger factor)